METEQVKTVRLSWSVVLGMMAVEAAALVVLIGGVGLVVVRRCRQRLRPV